MTDTKYEFIGKHYTCMYFLGFTSGIRTGNEACSCPGSNLDRYVF